MNLWYEHSKLDLILYIYFLILHLFYIFIIKSMSKKNIILGLFLILLSFVFILYFVYFHDKSFKANNLNQKVNTNNLNQKVNTNNIMECVIDDETWVNLLSALDFTGAYSYYDNQINISKNLDDKILYEIKKAYWIFSEWEILNKQEEYFKKWKIILDDIKNEKKYNCWEYYRVYAFGYEMTRDYKNAINMYQKALSLFEKAWEKTYKSFIVSILWSLWHTYMLLWNPYEAQNIYCFYIMIIMTYIYAIMKSLWSSEISYDVILIR